MREREFQYDTVSDTSSEMLNVAASGYEAIAADAEFIGLALRESFRAADGREAYRNAAENIFDEDARAWRTANGYPE